MNPLETTIIITPDLGSFDNADTWRKHADAFMGWQLAYLFSYYGKEVPEGALLHSGANHNEVGLYEKFQENLWKRPLEEIKELGLDESCSEYMRSRFLERFPEARHESHHYHHITRTHGALHVVVNYGIVSPDGELVMVRQPYRFSINDVRTGSLRSFQGNVGSSLVEVGSRENLHRVYKEVIGKDFPAEVPQKLEEYVNDQTD